MDDRQFILEPVTGIGDGADSFGSEGAEIRLILGDHHRVSASAFIVFKISEEGDGPSFALENEGFSHGANVNEDFPEDPTPIGHDLVEEDSFLSRILAGAASAPTADQSSSLPPHSTAVKPVREGGAVNSCDSALVDASAFENTMNTRMKVSGDASRPCSSVNEYRTARVY